MLVLVFFLVEWFAKQTGFSQCFVPHGQEGVRTHVEGLRYRFATDGPSGAGESPYRLRLPSATHQLDHGRSHLPGHPRC